MKKNCTLFAGSLLLLCVHCTILNAQFTNGQSASVVLGQPDFKSNQGVTTQQGMYFPQGVAVDKSGNLYVADFNNSRVLIFKNAISKTSGANADFVLGQTDFTSSGFLPPQGEMNYPVDVCLDNSGNLYVADQYNSRILIFKNVESEVNSGTLTNGANADFVLGQPDFTSTTTNTTQNGMNTPNAINVDNSGNLYVAESANDRVLVFKNIEGRITNGTLTNGVNADYVLGEPNFTSSNGPVNQSGMNTPSGVVIDPSGNLYVSDFGSLRILIFKNIVSRINAGTLTNDANADFVLGQPNFTTFGSGGSPQNSFGGPNGLGIDMSGNLYVADEGNNRVMIFKQIQSRVTNGTLTNDANADAVLGQLTFTTYTSGTAADSLYSPNNTALDAAGNLFVSDAKNNRVLIFKNTLLPVTLISFAAYMPNQSTVKLTWSTSSEENTDHFDLMRSKDGIHYSNIASINAAGNSDITRNYNYLDNVAKISFTGAIYYQLSEVDIDGKTQLSPVVLVKPDETSSGVNLWPNPFSDHVQLSVGSDVPKTISVSIFSNDGKIIHRQSYSLAKGENQISILNLDNLPAGVYQLVGFDQGKILFNKKIVKQ